MTAAVGFSTRGTSPAAQLTATLPAPSDAIVNGVARVPPGQAVQVLGRIANRRTFAVVNHGSVDVFVTGEPVQDGGFLMPPGSSLTLTSSAALYAYVEAGTGVLHWIGELG